MNTAHFLLLWLDAFTSMKAPCPRCQQQARAHKMSSPLGIEADTALGARMVTTFTCGEKLTVFVNDPFGLLVGA